MPHTLTPSNVNSSTVTKKNQHRNIFFKRTLEVSHGALKNRSGCSLNQNFKRTFNRNHQIKLLNHNRYIDNAYILIHFIISLKPGQIVRSKRRISARTSNKTFFERDRDIKSLLFLKTIWSYCTLINIKLGIHKSISVQQNLSSF